MHVHARAHVPGHPHACACMHTHLHADKYVILIAYWFVNTPRCYVICTLLVLFLQIYSHRPLLRDTFLGQVGIPAPLNHEPTLLRTELLLDDNTEGSLELYVLTDDNFMRV
jgi:hypothetical protein